MKATNDNSSFNFLCPHCSQSLEATAELIGKSLDCPNCAEKFTVPANKNAPARKIPTLSRNFVVTVLVTALITSAFWWLTPFLARAHGKQAAKGALSALQEEWGLSEQQKSEKEKLKSVVKDKISLTFEGNQRVTITNNSDLEIYSISFEYTNADDFRVARGEVGINRQEIKSGKAVTKDISSSDTIKPKFKVRPSSLKFWTDPGIDVPFPD
jgi:hypothetical protein